MHTLVAVTINYCVRILLLLCDSVSSAINTRISSVPLELLRLAIFAAIEFTLSSALG